MNPCEHNRKESLHMLTLPTSVYWDTRQASDVLHLSPGTLENYRYQGKGPAFIKPGGGRVLYRPAVVIAWAESQELAA